MQTVNSRVSTSGLWLRVSCESRCVSGLNGEPVAGGTTSIGVCGGTSRPILFYWTSKVDRFSKWAHAAAPHGVMSKPLQFPRIVCHRVVLVYELMVSIALTYMHA